MTIYNKYNIINHSIFNRLKKAIKASSKSQKMHIKDTFRNRTVIKRECKDFFF